MVSLPLTHTGEARSPQSLRLLNGCVRRQATVTTHTGCKIMRRCTGKKKMKDDTGISRRNFLKYSGIVFVGAGIGYIPLRDGRTAIPVSGGYLLVDTKKCQGCVTCMLACSLVHEGQESLSLSRIQIVQNPFEKFPEDITLSQCRQCVEPACVAVCPTGALHADTAHGNVRLIDQEKCIGCKQCIEACPFEPGRTIWNFEKSRSQKCDLCTNSPFWNEQGGIGGKQACVETCPLGVIQFTTEIPEEYTVNLRGEVWGTVGYPRD